MAKLALSGRAAKSRQLAAEAQMQTERMRDVQLLFAHMLRQEDVTIKFILDCLYDVGSVNLINQKVRSQPLNQLTKAIAVMSKPAFKLFALRWLYKNCPALDYQLAVPQSPLQRSRDPACRDCEQGD